MSFLKDMSQQANNARFIRHIIKISYRSCRCLKKERENLNYDIEVNNRYHVETLQQRQYVEELNVSKRQVFVRDTEIRLTSSSIAKLVSALNLIQSRSYDVSYSE